MNGAAADAVRLLLPSNSGDGVLAPEEVADEETESLAPSVFGAVDLMLVG